MKKDFKAEKSCDNLLNTESDLESPIGIIETDTNKISSKTPNIVEEREEILPDSIKIKSFNETKEGSKSLDFDQQDKRENSNKDDLKNNNDETNSNSLSLIRNKSEQNLKESKESKGTNGTDGTKDKTYNSKNFFTENFDDEEMEAAINKIKSNPDFGSADPPAQPSGEPGANIFDEQPQNIEFSKEEESISFDEDSKRAARPLINVVEGPCGDARDDDSSASDSMDLTKTVDLKKEGFFKALRPAAPAKRAEPKPGNLFEGDFDFEQPSRADAAKHSKSLDEPKAGPAQKAPPKATAKDTRQKIDDDDEEGIITGSHIIESQRPVGPKEAPQPDSMAAYFKYSKVVKEDTLTGDVKVMVDDICQSLIAELDKELFPQRPLFLLTADLSGITLEQATTLLNDLTPEKERIIVEKIIERQKESKRHKKSSRSKTDLSKLVLYEKKGIRTDLLAIEGYVEGLHLYIDKNKKKEFMKAAFTSLKKDPFAMLNLLQNSDIGSYEHFEVDMNEISVLQIEDYLEMENYIKLQEKEEAKTEEIKEAPKNPNEKPARPKRKRFEFDETGLTEKQIQDKKKFFRE